MRLLSQSLLHVLGPALFFVTGAVTAQQEEVTYYHYDALGSPVVATDETGAVKWREAYAPYGGRLLEESREQDCSVNPCESTNSPWENRQFYTGKYDEADTGLTYFGARWYDPSLGRFLSVDPVEFQEGSVFSFNRYSYANNNPYLYVDPDGRFALFGFLVGAGLEAARQAITGELSLSWSSAGKISISGVSGTTGVGLGRGVANLTGNVLVRAGANASAGAVLGASVTAANNAVDGREMTAGVGIGAATGAIGGFGGSLIGDGLDASISLARSRALSKIPISTKNLYQHIDEATRPAHTSSAAPKAVGIGEAIGNAVSGAGGAAQAAACKSGVDSC
ncbi:RHS repeat domain-containing protein [Congregibacter litoralis]|uniref:RHS repeat protein-associated core domain protein n=1 Tax=Congregibacter litoralis KT71 TaxID=314285 RepID=A4ACT6_9GAMM|nr:RHS repeat-associated core domain-containing protein [Congregibacter litoralis]EAQ96127.1 RHS repeat protein-associated core domain protein [Congregibacter litoralis KT71]